MSFGGTSVSRKEPLVISQGPHARNMEYWEREHTRQGTQLDRCPSLSKEDEASRMKDSPRKSEGGDIGDAQLETSTKGDKEEVCS